MCAYYIRGTYKLARRHLSRQVPFLAVYFYERRLGRLSGVLALSSVTNGELPWSCARGKSKQHARKRNEKKGKKIKDWTAGARKRRVLWVCGME
jgi:hypothetical protein